MAARASRTGRAKLRPRQVPLVWRPRPWPPLVDQFATRHARGGLDPAGVERQRGLDLRQPGAQVGVGPGPGVVVEHAAGVGGHVLFQPRRVEAARRRSSTFAWSWATSASTSGGPLSKAHRSPGYLGAHAPAGDGGAGFIGANFVSHTVENHPDHEVVVVDAFTYAGHRSSLAPVADRITVVEADICDEATMDGVMAGCDVVVHFAAESHVDRSIDDPGPFLRTNIMGTETLLRVARKHDVGRFHHISTDEVFGALPPRRGTLRRGDALRPPQPLRRQQGGRRSPRPAATARPTACRSRSPTAPTTTGPTTFRKRPSRCSSPTPSTGSPCPSTATKSVRDYLYVTDHCRAIDLVVHAGRGGLHLLRRRGCRTRPGWPWPRRSSTPSTCPGTGSQFVADRPGHDRRYAIDATRIGEDLGWKPSVSFEEGNRRHDPLVPGPRGLVAPASERRPASSRGVPGVRGWSRGGR